ncbi:MAG: SDR family NAD(P)-dependent oxidoreductase [bacterium]|nr:SDR family NAD(P)-dependent oxidoreductase [bacterium]
MTKKVTLVTGGAGFIGTHLASYLGKQGRSVVVLDDLSSGSRQNLQQLKVTAELIEKDIADPAALESLKNYGIDTIYHLASQANVPLSVRQPVTDFDTNMRGTLNVLEFARAQGAQVIFPSTVSVYSKDSVKPIPETASIHASSPYGAAKAGGENYCYAYANCYGVRTVVARLFNVYGPLMNKYVIYDFVRKLQANPREMDIIGNGRQTRDYTYVEDAVRALVLLSEKGESGTAYNLGNGEPVRIIDLARLISEEMGLTGVKFNCTNQEAVGDISEWYADLTRLRSLGYKPETSFREGLRRTVQYIVGTK